MEVSGLNKCFVLTHPAKHRLRGDQMGNPTKQVSGVSEVNQQLGITGLTKVAHLLARSISIATNPSEVACSGAG